MCNAVKSCQKCLFFYGWLSWHKYYRINLHSIPQNNKLDTEFPLLNDWKPSLKTVLKVFWLQFHPPVFLGVMLQDLRIPWHSSPEILVSLIRLDGDYRWADIFRSLCCCPFLLGWAPQSCGSAYRYLNLWNSSCSVSLSQQLNTSPTPCCCTITSPKGR